MQKYNCVSDASAFYKAFGFTPKTGENPDSIMYQLEFLALLLVKIAIAPNNENRNVTEDAYRKFWKTIPRVCPCIGKTLA
ncbi:MAG: molecular chaperone TorD family protein [Chitinophagales bacterium]